MLSTSLERLSSGLRINSAKDDAAGLAISERFTSQIRGLNQGVRNANDGISLVQTAEGALKEVTSNLQRIRELAVQSSNATNTAVDRAALQDEVTQLVAEIERVATNTKFNGIALLDGSFVSQGFQVGADAGETIQITSITDTNVAAIGGSYSASIVATGTVGGGAIAAGGMFINGIEVGATTADGFSVSTTTSALSIANAVNAVSGSTGVTASASTQFVATGNSVVSAVGTSTGASQSFTLNGSTITYTSSSTNAATNANAAVTAINNATATTGVSATYVSGAITLTAADGRDITLEESANNATVFEELFAVGNTVGVNGSPLNTDGTVTFTSGSSDGFIVTSSAANYATRTASAAQSAILGVSTTQANTTAGSGGVAIANVSVGTVSGAQATLTSVDTALQTINDSRASLGAYQNRFTSVVTNLQTASENLSASRSRIVDADFASETASMTKAQILQQSGIAMLAQANSIPQNVLALLQ
jgi:flagellin